MFSDYLFSLEEKLKTMSKAEVRITYSLFFYSSNKYAGYELFLEKNFQLIIFQFIEQKEKNLEHYFNQYNCNKEEEIYLKYI